MVFLFHFTDEHIPVNSHRFLLACRNGNDKLSVAWYGVVHLAGVELCHAHVHLLHLGVDESCENLYCVGAFLVDVVARVSSRKSFYRSFEEEKACRGGFAAEVERGEGGTSAGAAHENLSLVLAVKVNKHIARHESCLHTACTCQLCLFVASEYTLYWSVLNVVAVKYR